MRLAATMPELVHAALPDVLEMVPGRAVSLAEELLFTAAAVTDAFAEGTAENPAIANADAATSAMRLKLVFVDIIFLSRKVAIKNFFITAWPRNAFS
jgi:hypothetical protein